MAGYDPSTLGCITCSFEVPGVLWAGRTPQLQPHQWGQCWLPINTQDPQGGTPPRSEGGLVLEDMKTSDQHTSIWLKLSPCLLRGTVAFAICS